MTGRQGIVQGRVGTPGQFVAGQRPAQGSGVVAVDEQPEQGLLQIGGVRCQAQGGFETATRFGQAAGVLLVGTGQAQEFRHALQPAQGAARRVGRRVQLAQQRADLAPAIAVGVQGQRLDQVAGLVELLPGPGRDGGGFGRRGEVEQAEQGVVIARFGFVGLDQAAEGVDRLGVALLHFGQLAAQAPVVDIAGIVQAGAGPGFVEPGQRFVAAPLEQQHHGNAQGPASSQLCRVGEQALPGLQGGIGFAGPFGELGEQFEDFRAWLALAQSFEIGDGRAGFAQAFLCCHQFADQADVLRLAGDLVVQGGNQGGIVEQARGQAQHGLPGFVLARRPGDFQPVVEGDLRPGRPFGNAGQALAPGEVVGRLADGGAGHLPGIFEFAVFEKHLVAEGEDPVVEGDARAARGALFRDMAEFSLAPGAGDLQCLPLLAQRELQQAPDVAVGDFRAAGGTAELGEQEQGVGVVGQVAQFAFTKLQGGQRLVAGLQRPQRGVEMTPCLPGIAAAAAGQQIKLGTAAVVAMGQGVAGGPLEQGAGLRRIVEAVGECLEQGLAKARRVVLVGLAGQLDLLFEARRLLGQLLHLAQHVALQGGAFGRSRGGQAPVVAFGDLEQHPPGSAACRLVVGVEGRLQGRTRGIQLVHLELLAGQQQTQAGVVRVAAQQVGEVGGGQRRVRRFCQTPFEVGARIEQ